MIDFLAACGVIMLVVALGLIGLKVYLGNLRTPSKPNELNEIADTQKSENPPRA